MAAPRRRFGQHFLERAWAEKVVRLIAAGEHDVMLEIGPGRGALTHLLAARASQVVAFEIDRDLVAALRASVRPNVTIVEGDFLAQTRSSIEEVLTRLGVAAAPLRVAGNLPYNVAAPILFALLALRRGGLPIADATVMLQREVADRLTAAPGTRDFGVLSILVQHEAAAERVLTLPPGAFRPPPKVHSAVVRLALHGPQPVPNNRAAFEAMARAIFTRRRKTLANALQAYRPGAAAALGAVGIDGRRRPETLSLPELVALSDAIG